MSLIQRLLNEAGLCRNETAEDIAVLLEEAANALTASEKLRELALIWSAYQDDDSKRDQATDPQLRQQAENAELALLEALL